MDKFEGIANTLFIPLVARINVSKKFPEYFIDTKALELEPYIPEGVNKGSTEYSDIASASRYYNMDKMITAFVKERSPCNLVCLGAGLETSYDRLNDKFVDVHWYEVDLPEVIEARKTVLGERENETLIPNDIFKLKWVNEIDRSLPALFIVSGVFQYFHEEQIVMFIKSCASVFLSSEMIFDSTSKRGLVYANRFIKRTGNHDTLLHFGIDDCKVFAAKCGVRFF